MATQPSGVHGWFLNQISLGNLAIIISFVITASVFYADTRSTTAAQSAAIQSINNKMVENDRAEERKDKIVAAERERLRAEVTARAEKTAESLASIETKTAILSTQLTSIREDIVKLSQQIISLATATNRK